MGSSVARICEPGSGIGVPPLLAARCHHVRCPDDLGLSYREQGEPQNSNQDELGLRGGRHFGGHR